MYTSEPGSQPGAGPVRLPGRSGPDAAAEIASHSAPMNDRRPSLAATLVRARSARLGRIRAVRVSESGAGGLQAVASGSAVTPRQDAGVKTGRGAVRFPHREPAGKLKTGNPMRLMGLRFCRFPEFLNFRFSSVPATRGNTRQPSRAEAEAWPNVPEAG